MQPTLIPATSLLAKVDGAMNAVAVCGDAVGTTLYYGAGAGELPTASAVVGDLIEIARELRRGSAGRVAPLAFLPHALARRELVPLGDLFGRAYLRFTAAGSAGRARAHHRRARRARDRHRVRDPEGPGEPLRLGARADADRPRARGGACAAALEKIDRLPDVTAPTKLIRIEEDL